MFNFTIKDLSVVMIKKGTLSKIVYKNQKVKVEYESKSNQHH